MFFVMVTMVFLYQHNGWNGDDHSKEEGISDTPKGGGVVFNNWRLRPDQELFPKAFIVINIPAFAAGRILFRSLGWIIEEFEQPCPLGLSSASYTIMVGFLLSLAQWYGIGLACEKLRKKRLARYGVRPV
jgi:hypothetical protein